MTLFCWLMLYEIICFGLTLHMTLFLVDILYDIILFCPSSTDHFCGRSKKARRHVQALPWTIVIIHSTKFEILE